MDLYWWFLETDNFNPYDLYIDYTFTSTFQDSHINSFVLNITEQLVIFILFYFKKLELNLNFWLIFLLKIVMFWYHPFLRVFILKYKKSVLNNIYVKHVVDCESILYNLIKYRTILNIFFESSEFAISDIPSKLWKE